MSNYHKTEWKEFRENILEGDNYTCVRCGRSREDGVILQVHHLIYHKGRKPWQYATEECETLCKGCHGAEHGYVIPKFGWEFIEMEDLGDLIGECEFCNNPLRYSFAIFHENWGTINVGTGCCDNLTDSDLASNEKESFLRYSKRKSNFITSKRWKNDLLTTSLNGRSIFRLSFDDQKERLISYERIFVGERIRDIIYLSKLKKFLIVFEESASIGIMSNLN